MDAIEFLSSRTKMHEVYTTEISLSFCSYVDGKGQNLKESLVSISTIASEIGFPFEIIIVSTPGNDHLTRQLAQINEKIENLYIVKERPENYGNALRIGYDSSKGKYFVPFDLQTAYDIRYSDLIHTFLVKREKKLFLSELPVIHRDLISEVGGYRDLSDGFDIDLYSRIAMMYGLVAYPALFNRVPLVSPPPSSENHRSSSGRGMAKYRRQRDHAIACNYEFSDLAKIYSPGRDKKSLIVRGYLALLYAGIKVSRIKPYKFDRNNFLILMESIFESLVLRDFARYGINDIKANMILTKEEIEYLKSESKVYRDVIYSISQYVLEV